MQDKNYGDKKNIKSAKNKTNDKPPHLIFPRILSHLSCIANQFYRFPAARHLIYYYVYSLSFKLNFQVMGLINNYYKRDKFTKIEKSCILYSLLEKQNTIYIPSHHKALYNQISIYIYAL